MTGTHATTIGPLVSGAATTVLGAAGTVLGLTAIFEPLPRVCLPWLLPLSGVEFEVSRLGGFFMALTGAVALVVGVYSVGYLRHERLGSVAQVMLPAFVAAMLLVPAAGSVATFLLCWELMALSSLVLLAADHRRPQVRSAAVYYAVMTQPGFTAVLVGLMVLAAAAGPVDSPAWTSHRSRVRCAM